MFNSVNNIIRKWLKAKKTQQDVIALDIHSNHGIGAKLIWVLEILAYSDEKKLLPRFRFSYPNDINGVDYFNAFFGIKGAANNQTVVEFRKIKTIGELELGRNYNDALDIEYANHLINKYLYVRDDVIHEVDDFCVRNFSGKRVLGVHYRGTDKVSEAPGVPYDIVERNVNTYLDKFPSTSVVFISSDDHHFIEYMANCTFTCPIVYRDDTFRSTDDSSIHHSGQNRYDINHDALINCLILSRCDALMKTASILSAFSKLLNPELPLIMLNKPFDNCTWFPERDLIDSDIYAPIPE